LVTRSSISYVTRTICGSLVQDNTVAKGASTVSSNFIE
jgi:hypothetical protein